MKKLFFSLAVILASVSMVSAGNNVQTSDDYTGNYTGTASNVDMNGVSVDDISGLTFTVGEAGKYYLDGAVNIKVIGSTGAQVDHVIDFRDQSVEFDIVNGVITNASGYGKISVSLGGRPMGSFTFDLVSLQGVIDGSVMSISFESIIPEYRNFTASFDFNGVK